MIDKGIFAVLTFLFMVYGCILIALENMYGGVVLFLVGAIMYVILIYRLIVENKEIK